MRKYSIIVIALGAALVAGWVFWRTASGMVVEVVTPKIGTAVQAVYATGTVEATVMMPIAPRVTARLIELNADEGSKVEKDQILARLEDTDLANNLRERQAREDQARREFQRYASLVRQNNVSRAMYDNAKGEWESAQAARKAAEAQLGFTRLLAPAEGVVIRRDGEVGQLIAANQPVFWLSCCAPLRISAEVDEEDIAQVQPGQKVLIQADAFPGKIYAGRVKSITPKGDPIARSYRVRIEFTEPNSLLIGMTAETNIILQEKESAMLVPASAVQEGYVWRVQKGRLRKQKVTLGVKDEEEVEILSGLTLQDEIALAPQLEWEEGQPAKKRIVIPTKVGVTPR